ncbi:MAG: hypothetical protein DME18_16390 [Verrucomicrobia bacterium]|nr:MAG: hypothetical protein DME18_16390 [Verrucomicrobiota bacterium]
MRLFTRMNADSLKCSVCGGTMKPVKVLPNKSGRWVRFRCTCGHREDLSDNKPSLGDDARGLLVPDGFEELS